MIHLREHFRDIERRRRAQWFRRQQGAYRTQQEEHHKEEIAARLDDSLMSFAIEVVQASSVRPA